MEKSFEQGVLEGGSTELPPEIQLYSECVEDSRNLLSSGRSSFRCDLDDSNMLLSIRIRVILKQSFQILNFDFRFLELRSSIVWNICS